jgi:hypothetical protein
MVLAIHRVKHKKLNAIKDRADPLLLLILVWAPPNIGRLSLDNEAVIWSISLMVRNCQHLV